MSLVWDLENIEAFIRNTIREVLRRSLSDNEDLLTSKRGCDSIQAASIHKRILCAVEEHSPLAAKRLQDINIVARASTISALTDAVLEAVHDSPTMPAEATVEDLVRIAEWYSLRLPERPSQLRSRERTGDVVVITGTTRGFGCDVLEHLLRDDKVAMVYALNRPRTRAMERQYAQFGERGLDVSLLSSTKFKMIEANVYEPGFGIAEVLLEEIRDSVTHIMHNAWSVNFNAPLPTFEENIRALRNLVEFSLSSPYTDAPIVQLVSSIGILDNCTIPPPIPEIPMEPSSALGTGYFESKWIAEKILLNVSQRTGMRVAIVRLGQVAGNKKGHWTEAEWYPALVKSAFLVRCLPTAPGLMVAFIPGYPAARAFVEMRESKAGILHLVHPRPVAGHSLIGLVAHELQVPLVSFDTWLAALEKVNKSDIGSKARRENPALGLMDFWQSRVGPGGIPKEFFGLVPLSTTNACNESATLSNLPEISEADAIMWVAAWRASGFLDTHKSRPTMHHL